MGILVDDATVEIENTHRNLGLGKGLVRAVLDGASQIAVPTLVSTLSICIVFVPVLLLTGTARYLFTPLAMAVVFAMLASYLLSRTLIPTMVHHLLRTEAVVYQTGGHGGKGIFWSVHRGANSLFERLPALWKTSSEIWTCWLASAAVVSPVPLLRRAARPPSGLSRLPNVTALCWNWETPWASFRSLSSGDHRRT